MSSKTFIREIRVNKNKFNIFLINPDFTDEFKLPYVLAYPEKCNKDARIILETNNYELSQGKLLDWNNKCDKEKIINNAIDLVIGNNGCSSRIEWASKVNAPFMMPILPSVSGGIPYFQQLSNESLCQSNIDVKSDFYRIDKQVCQMIYDATNFLNYNNENINSRVFLHGYSTSGVFAQRFAFLHPEFVDTAVIGGAIGSIPMPPKCFGSDELNYPLGIQDYDKFDSVDFNEASYNKVHFFYYVSGMEDINKVERKFDDKIKNVPMHDMSYLERSVLPTDGIIQRYLYGTNMFKRADKQIKMLKKQGYKFKSKVNVKKFHRNGLISDDEFKKVYEDGVFEENGMSISKYNFIRVFNRILGFIMIKSEIKKNIKGNNLLNASNEKYEKILKDVNINNDKNGLASLFLDEVKNSRIVGIIENLNEEYEGSLYNERLKTKMSEICSFKIAYDFLCKYFPEKSNIFEKLLKPPYKYDGEQFIQLSKYKDEENLKFYNTKFDVNEKGYQMYSENASTTIYDNNDVMIYIPLKGDMGDVYRIVHEVTHCLDTKNGDNDTRKIMGEIVPQYMEYLLGEYLLKLPQETVRANGLNKNLIYEDVQKRAVNIFVDRYNMIKKIKMDSKNKNILTRYMLAQIYLGKFMDFSNDNDRKNKINEFVNAVIENDFFKANECIGVHIYEDDFLCNRNGLVKNSIQLFKISINNMILSENKNDVSKKNTQKNNKGSNNKDTKLDENKMIKLEKGKIDILLNNENLER